MGRAGARKARSALFTLTAALQIVLICSVAAGAAASVDPAGDQPLQGASPAGSECASSMPHCSDGIAGT